MPMADYPDELRPATWEKKKGAMPARSPLAETLKALQRKHEAIEWKQFEPGWTKQAKTPAELDRAHAALDKTWRTSVFALKKDATEAAAAAQQLEKAKGAEKPQVDAMKAIGAAVKAYLRAIDAGVDELQKSHDAARGAVAAAADDDKDDGPGSKLLDPKRLLQQLQTCQRKPDYRAEFGFVDGKDKQPPALAMHHSISARTLFAKLQEETGVKAGAYGRAWVDGKTLILQVEKAFSGLVKKARIPIKNCGFRISRIALWSADGTVLEQDESDEAAEGQTVAADEGKKTPADELAAQWERIKTAVSPELAKEVAKNPPNRAELMALAASAAAHARSGAYAEAIAEFRKLHAMLAGAGAGAAAGAREATAEAAADFSARLKDMAPSIAAVTSGRENNPEAAALIAEMTMLAKAQDYAAAAALLGRIEGMLGSGLGSDFPQRWAQARQAWQVASDRVDTQIAQLQAALRREADADLQKIGEFGLNAITGNFKVPLMASIRTIGTGESVSPAALAQARKAAAGFLVHVGTDPRVAACDENPFNVEVNIRDTLGRALENLVDTLNP